MNALTQVQCHFVRDKINHRLRFGKPSESVRLDKYRHIALFQPSNIFGYIRWRANKYGTQDWRVYVIQTGADGPMTEVPGISPAAHVLVSIQGYDRVKRTLPLLDRLERDVKNGLESVPISYWRVFQSTVLRNKPLRSLPRHYRKDELSHAF